MASSITNTTFKKLNAKISSIIDIKNGVYTYFPGEKDKVTQLMQKINEIVPMSNIITPNFWDVKILSITYGITDEEARRDIQERLDHSTYMELRKEGEVVDATWRPACYTKPNEQTITYMYSVDDREFDTVSRNANEYFKLLGLKMSSAYIDETANMNNLTQALFKDFLKSVLKIYKNAPVFEANHTYKADGSDRRDTNIGLYDFQLTYLKNQDGSKYGVVFNDISAEDGYETFEAAVAAGKIRIINFIKKINKPHKSQKEDLVERNAENQAIAANFLRDVSNFDSLNTSDDSDDQHGRTLNGSETSTSEYLNSSVRILSNVLNDLVIDHVETVFNNAYSVPLLNRAKPTFKFFTPEEIAADEEGDKLGLGKIWGFIYDQSETNGKFGLLNLYITQDENDYYDNAYPKDIRQVKNYIPLHRYYYSNTKKIMEKISYNKYFCILMEE